MRTYPFRGRVTWLTPEQGGRASGPPETPEGRVFAATAFVPPWTAGDGLASFVLDVDDRHGWTSGAAGGWLAAQPEERFRVRAGTVVAVTEGPRVVAYFQVEVVDGPAVAASPGGGRAPEAVPAVGGGIDR